MQTTVEIHNYQGALRDWKALHCKYSMLPSAPVKIEHSLLITFVSDGTIFETDGINCKIARGSGATIAACTFWFLAAVTIFLLVPHGTISTNSIPYNSANGRHEHLDFTNDDDGFTMDEYDNGTNEGGGGRPYSDSVINTSST